MQFVFDATVLPEWLDYNGHMRDSNYGLVFSLAVDALQDEVGFDAAYRAETGCTIYLIEDHKTYLREVHEGDALTVATRVLDVDAKRFHLHMTMIRDGEPVCIAEFMELHVRQHPDPKAVPMPDAIQRKLAAARDAARQNPDAPACSRRMSFHR